MVAEIEGQIAMLGVPGLQRVQQRVSSSSRRSSPRATRRRRRHRRRASAPGGDAPLTRLFAEAVGSVR